MAARAGKLQEDAPEVFALQVNRGRRECRELSIQGHER